MAEPTDATIIPSDIIGLGFEPDGTPKAVPIDQIEPPVEVKPDAKKEAKPDRSEADLAAARAEAEAIRARLADAERRAQEADAKRQDTERALVARTDQALSAHYRSVRTDLDQIEGAIGQHQLLVESAKRDMLSAKEAGDAAREVDAQQRLAKFTSDISTLEQAKLGAQYEVNRAEYALRYQQQAPAEPEKKPEVKPDQPTQIDPIKEPDKWIGQFPRKTAAWLRENRDYVTDSSKLQQLLTFANEWSADYGQHTLHTPAFIDALRDRFSPPSVDNEEGPDVVTEPATKPVTATPAKPATRPVAAAPVSRGTEVYSSRSPNARAIKLPSKLAAKVKEMGLDPEQYALQAYADIKAGKLPPNYLDPDYDH